MRDSVQLSPPGPGDEFVWPTRVPVAPVPPASPSRVGARVRAVAAGVVVSVAALLAARAVVGARDVDLSVRSTSRIDDVPSGALIDSSSLAAVRSAGGEVGGRAGARRTAREGGGMRPSTSPRAARSAARARSRGDDEGNALPSVPRVAVRIDTRSLDDSLRARAESAIGSPALKLPPIARPQGPLPMVNGRRHDRRLPR